MQQALRACEWTCKESGASAIAARERLQRQGHAAGAVTVRSSGEDSHGSSASRRTEWRIQLRDSACIIMHDADLREPLVAPVPSRMLHRVSSQTSAVRQVGGRAAFSMS